jgi:4Fe-4S ferredoxin
MANTIPTIRGTSSDFKKPAGTLVPIVDRNLCEGKGPCVEVCPVDVFAMGTLPPEARQALTLKGKLKGFVHRWKQVEVIAPEACRACGLCVTACPEAAIKLARPPEKST